MFLRETWEPSLFEGVHADTYDWYWRRLALDGDTIVVGTSMEGSSSDDYYQRRHLKR